MHVGEKIRQLRLHQQLTQGDLVDGICSVAFLSKVEKGLSKPSAAILEKLAARLQIPVSVIDETQENDIGVTIDRITAKFLETAIITDEEARILDIERYYSQPLPRLLLMYSCLIHHWLDNQGRESLTYIEEIIEQSQKLISFNEERDYPIQFFIYYEAIASYYSVRNIAQKTELYLEYAGRFLQKTKLPPTRLATYYYISGVVASLHHNNSKLSRENYYKAINLFEQTGNKERIASIFCSIAWTYIYDQEYELALQAFQNVPKCGLLPKTRSILHNGYAKIYKNLNDFEKALHHLELAEVALSSLNQQDLLVYLLRAKVEIYIELKKWDKTDELIKKGVDISKEFSYHYNLCKFLQYKAIIQKTRSDYASFEKYIRDAIDCAISNNIIDLLIENATILADYYSDNGSYKKAVKYYRLALQRDKK